MLRALLIAFAAGLAIPALGASVALLIFADLNSELPDGLKVTEVCENPGFVSEVGLQDACSEIHNIEVMYQASIWSAVVIVVLLVTYLLAATVCGTNRKLLSRVFQPLVPLSLIVIAASVLVQGVILVGAIYFAEAYFIGSVHFILIGGIGLGAVAGAFSVLMSLFNLRTKAIARVSGLQLTPTQNAKVWDKVYDLAKRVGAQPPANIVVGLSPSFFVTNADVELINKKETISGETLYLSLPIMRLLTEEQLSSIIAHELGHFKGDDLAYSVKFAPVYRGLEDALGSLGDADGVGGISALPAAIILMAMHEVFSRNESKISRIREHEADKIAVEATSSAALGIGLAKFSIYAGFWGHVRLQNSDRVSKGRVAENLCTVFEDSTKYDVEHLVLSDVIDDIASSTIAHPTDTHPPIGARYKSIGFSKDLITVERLSEVGRASEGLIDNLVEIEQELSLFEHRLMIALGQAERPEEIHDEPSGIESAIYSLAAGMIGADGKIEPTEVKTAETIGASLLSEFDPVDFRSYCAHLNEIPDFRTTVDSLNEVFETPIKTTIYEYLMRIASSDGEVALEEAELLKYARKKWALDI